MVAAPKVEKRAITSVPWEPWDVGGPLRGPVSQARALSLVPVYAAVRHICDQVSTLPLKAYRRVGDAREPMGSLPQLFRLLDDEGRLPVWLTQAFSSLALRGNAVGLITDRDGMGFPTQVVWLSLDDIHVDDSDWPTVVWYWKDRRIPAENLVHIPWIVLAGRTLGLSPIEHYALSVTGGLSAKEYGIDWFKAGGVPPGQFKNENREVTEEQARKIKARLVASLRDHQPLVYGSDWDFKSFDIPSDQAQFIETAKLTANEIAAFYGIEPTELGGEAANGLTYTNEEHRQTRRLHDLRPWMIRVESGLSAQLPERQYVRFNADAVVRADIKTRHDVYKLGRDMGLYSVDELRAYEDLPPLPNGEGKEFKPEPKTPAVPPEPPPPPTPPERGNGYKPPNRAYIEPPRRADNGH